MITTVLVRHVFPGFHAWPDAPPSRNYLRHTHRHLFHVEAELDVQHDDREVEFHDLLDVVSSCCRHLGEEHPSGANLGSMSCEQIALHVVTAVQDRWPRRRVTATVLEDGECGARVNAGSTVSLLPS